MEISLLEKAVELVQKMHNEQLNGEENNIETYSNYKDFKHYKINDLLKQVLAELEINDTNSFLATKLYLDITTSSKFIYLGKDEDGDDVWDLKIYHKLEEFDKDGAAFNPKGEDVEDDEPEDEEGKPFTGFNQDDEEDTTPEESEDEEETNGEDEDQDSSSEYEQDIDFEGEDDDASEDEDDSFDEDKYDEYMDDYEDMYDDK